MATKHITDVQVCWAVQIAHANEYRTLAAEVLEKSTGQCKKVCYSAMERAVKRDLIEYGTSIRCPWLTEHGEQLLMESVL